MNELPQESTRDKENRLARLKERAQALIDQGTQSADTNALNALATTKLLEDLRIYQIELELQNEELRAAQQEAEMARRRYQSLFDQMPLPALVVDNHGMVDECNDRASALLDLRLPWKGDDNRFWRKISLADRSRMYVALRDVLPGQTMVLEQLAVAQTELSAQVFDAHLIGLSIDYKLDRRVLVLLVDRTAEVARTADQRFYSSLLDASDSLIYAVDGQGKVLLANQTLLNFLGCQRDEVQGHRREDFLPLHDAILHNLADQQVLKTGVPITLEEQLRTSNRSGSGSFITHKFPLHDVAGKLYGVAGISTDISALKEQQRLTLLSETVFMTCEEAIVITDADTCIVRVNPAFTRQSGFSQEAVLGQFTRMFKSGRQEPAYYKAMWLELEAQGHWSGEFINRRADGTYYTVLSNINAVRDDEGRVLHYIALQTDVTRLHEAQMALAHQASYDSLTGLPNRSLFNDRIEQLIISAKRHHKVFALLFVDLDRFKEVNDSLGHHVGDALLRSVAQRLQDTVRQEDTVARVGGDEFVVLLPGTNSAGAAAVANNLLAKLREPVMLDESLQYRPMASLGMAMFPEDGDSPDLLLRNADMAMYGAKVSGRNRIASYNPQMSQVNDHAFAIQTELAEAITQGQLRVYFQPKCELKSGALVGAEALVRWQRPGYGLVMPGEFIRIAEKSGLLVALDQWVMNDALRQLGVWMRAGLWRSGWRLAVNQNVADLQRPDMLTQLSQLLKTHQVPPQALELEITEDALLQRTAEQLARLSDLRAMGITLAIDDFGTGYSSLAYLRQLPVSVIKIDQSFVGSMLVSDNDAVLVHAIVDLAHNLGHTLVAEGVETLQQRERLSELGAEVAQGYLFGKPISADEFTQSWLVYTRNMPLAQ
jgi:diguanylate cyclase (GGDEF)-like protein/PAS domain S-box-containing protein